ncbi:g-type lectin s-receptor-like serine/threonine-protein kinase [Quercus suber]|uniref:G-type lectin s-receptor-like serine/threonine-protein kinase n=1 Tax=Quercus suber TaxID=58331 RepID=A0AAW0KP83_QUESU
MVVVFVALENGFDRQGGLVDGEFGSRIVSLVSCLRVLAFGFRGDAVGEVVVGAEVGDVTGVGEFGFEGASAGAHGLEADGVAVVRVVRVVVGAVARARALALLTMTQINANASTHFRNTEETSLLFFNEAGHKFELRTQLMALLARHHRKKFPKSDHASLIAFSNEERTVYIPPYLFLLLFSVVTPYNDHRGGGGNHSHEVHVFDRTYGCGKWQNLKIPCSHAITVLKALHRDVTRYIDPCDSLSNAIHTYSHHFVVPKSESLWRDVREARWVLDPQLLRAKGHPVKSRLRNEMDEVRQERGSRREDPDLREIQPRQRCGLCHQEGHNRRSCPISRGASTSAVLDDAGSFGIFYGEFSDGAVYVYKNDNDNGGLSATSNMTTRSAVLRRLSLESNGNIRLYRWDDDVNGSRQWVPEWAAVSNPCDIAGICGNGVCNLDGSKTNSSCTCLPGTSKVEGSSQCSENSSLIGKCDSQHKYPTSEFRISTVQQTNYYYSDFSVIANYSDIASVSKCGDACLSDCDCVASVYGLDDEKPYCWVLRNLDFGGFEDSGSTLFVKVRSNGSNTPERNSGGSLEGSKNARTKVLVIPIVLSMTLLIGLLCLLLYYNIHRRRALKRALESSLILSGAPLNFSYCELQTRTWNFSQLLGIGRGRDLEVVELDVFPDLLDGVGARGLGGAVEEFAELRRELNHLLTADVGTSFGSSERDRSTV